MIMERIRKTEPKGSEIPQMMARKKFGRYKDETVKSTRDFHSCDDGLSRKFAKLWEKVQVSSSGDERYAECHQEFRQVLTSFGDTRFSAQDITRISFMLEKFQEDEFSDFPDKAGFFLSAAINKSPDNDFEVHTSHLDHAPNFLGMWNEKNITIIGDGGSQCGRAMGGGIITITGNTGLAAFELEGGKMIIEGDADMIGLGMSGGSVLVKGDHRNYFRDDPTRPMGGALGEGMIGGVIKVLGNVYAESAGHGLGGIIEIIGNVSADTIGQEMERGKIFISGDVNGLIGNEMYDGEIHIGGELGELGDIKGGRIFHKGKLMVGK
jgi:formylmethanofuran dehydrogenase subunit C